MPWKEKLLYISSVICLEVKSPAYQTISSAMPDSKAYALFLNSPIKTFFKTFAFGRIALVDRPLTVLELA